MSVPNCGNVSCVPLQALCATMGTLMGSGHRFGLSLVFGLAAPQPLEHPQALVIVQRK